MWSPTIVLVNLAIHCLTRAERTGSPKTRVPVGGQTSKSKKSKLFFNFQIGIFKMIFNEK
jgi:hypothetical protein